jgi:hypothetical protein
MKRALLLVLAFCLVAVPIASAGSGKTPCKGKHPKPSCVQKKKKKAKPNPPTSPAPATLAQRLAVGAKVYDLVDGFGSMWARVGADTANGGDTIERIDPATNAVIAKITVGIGFGLTVGDGAVWAPNSAPATLTRIDPTTNGIAAVIPLPGVGPDATATTPGAVWVGMEGDLGAPGLLVRVDPRTNKVAGTTVVYPDSPEGVERLAATANAIWLVTGAHLARADAATGAVTRLPGTITTGTFCGNLAADDTGVWIAPERCVNPPFKLAKLDGITGGIAVQVNMASTVDVALGLGGVWVTTLTGTLARLSPAGAVLGSMKLDLTTSTVIAVAFGSIWIGDSAGALERFSPR